MSSESRSPPPSPRLSTARLTLYNISQALIRTRRFRNNGRIVSSSGPQPITHSSLSGAVSTPRVNISRDDEFICASGVDIPKLLRACRSTLLDRATAIGANVLVDEQYVTICYSPSLTSEHFFVGGVPPLFLQENPRTARTRFRSGPANNDLSTCFSNPPSDPILCERRKVRRTRPRETRCLRSSNKRPRTHDDTEACSMTHPYPLSPIARLPKTPTLVSSLLSAAFDSVPSVYCQLSSPAVYHITPLQHHVSTLHAPSKSPKASC